MSRTIGLAAFALLCATFSRPARAQDSLAEEIYKEARDAQAKQKQYAAKPNAPAGKPAAQPYYRSTPGSSSASPAAQIGKDASGGRPVSGYFMVRDPKANFSRYSSPPRRSTTRRMPRYGWLPARP